MKNSMDEMLKTSLTPIYVPDDKLNEKIMEKIDTREDNRKDSREKSMTENVRERGRRKTIPVKRTAILVFAAVMLLGTTVFAAVNYYKIHMEKTGYQIEIIKNIVKIRWI